MTQRIDARAVAPEAINGWLATEGYLAKSTLGAALLDLVRLRASQINGCAYCIDMHVKDARARGESEQRLFGLDAWRESPFYSERERAALEWTEALTRIADSHAPDSAYDIVRAQLSEREIVDLTVCIAQINAWNRASISLRSQPGTYVSHVTRAAS